MSGSMDKGQIAKIAIVVLCLVGAAFFLFKDQIFKDPPPPPLEEPERTPEVEEFERQYQEELENTTPAGA